MIKEYELTDWLVTRKGLRAIMETSDDEQYLAVDTNVFVSDTDNWANVYDNGVYSCIYVRNVDRYYWFVNAVNDKNSRDLNFTETIVNWIKELDLAPVKDWTAKEKILFKLKFH